MARTSNRGSTSSSGGNRSSRNNNPAGRNQYSGSGMMDLARGRPIAAAAVAAGAAAAGLFLWSKRSQISEQLSGLSDQIGEWTENMRSDSDSGMGDSSISDSSESESFMARPSRGRSKSQSDIAEEAMTIKSTGKKSQRPSDPTIDAQTKAGAVAY